MPFFQPKVPSLPAGLDFYGKTALVTGANSGLGRAACLHYLQRNISTLIITVRRVSEGQAVRSQLLADSIVKSRKDRPEILVYELDLSNPSSVTAFASKIQADIPRLHILLLNAGIFSLSWEVSPYTLNELSFQVNYLSNAILCLSLIPLLRSTAESTSPPTPSHLSIVGSRKYGSSRFIRDPISDATLIFDAFRDEKSFEPWSSYPDSKLLVYLFLRELARHVDPSTIIVNCTCPGMVHTNLSSGLSLPMRILASITLLLRARSPEVGTRILVNATAADKTTHGELLVIYDVHPVLPWVESKSGQLTQQKLWDETLDVAEKIDPSLLEPLDVV